MLDLNFHEELQERESEDPHIYLETSHVRNRDRAIKQLMGERSEMLRKAQRGGDTLLALVAV